MRERLVSSLAPESRGGLRRASRGWEPRGGNLVGGGSRSQVPRRRHCTPPPLAGPAGPTRLRCLPARMAGPAVGLMQAAPGACLPFRSSPGCSVVITAGLLFKHEARGRREAFRPTKQQQQHQLLLLGKAVCWLARPE